MDNYFERTEMLIGSEGLKKLQDSKVLVLGIGGVGSYVVEALARSGVGHLALCDNDVIDVTNINRQIHANVTTVGKVKAEVMADRIRQINPEIQVTLHPYLYNSESANKIVTEDLDYVVDAIDMVTSKLYLVGQCHDLKIPLLASMGTGNKMNPMMLEVADINKTSVCPLAKVMRKELKKRGIKKLKVIYSKERPLKPLNLPSNKIEVSENGYSRRGIPGSMAFVPSVAGLIIASEVVKDLLHWGE